MNEGVGMVKEKGILSEKRRGEDEEIFHRN